MRELKRNWQDLFLSFRVAFDVRKIVLALTGLVLTGVVSGLIASLFGYGSQVASALKNLVSLNPPRVFGIPMLGELYGLEEPGGLPFVSGRFQLLCVILGVLKFLIWSLFVGGICRLAVVEIVRDERIEFGEALRFAWRKKWSFIWAPLTVFLAIVFFGLCNVMGGLVGGAFYYLLGIGIGLGIFAWLVLVLKDKVFGGRYAGSLVGGIIWLIIWAVIWWVLGKFAFRPEGLSYRIPWLGEIIVGLLSGFAFLSSFLMVLLGIGLLFGLGLMYSTVSTEGTDSFDAISRAFSYVFSRPWHYVWYCVVAIAYGLACFLFVSWVAELTIHASIVTAGVGLGSTNLQTLREVLTWSRPFGDAQAMAVPAFFIRVWIGLIRLAVWSLVVSYVCTAWSGIYLLMRRKVDGTDPGEVYLEEAEEALTAEPAQKQPEAEVQAPAPEKAQTEGSSEQSAEPGKA